MQDSCDRPRERGKFLSNQLLYDKRENVITPVDWVASPLALGAAALA